MKHKPLYERILTVSGNTALTTPGNYRVRVGTPAEYILDLAQTRKEEIGKLLFGGPMMGTAVPNLQTPITKLTSGLLVLSAAEALKPDESCCIRCGKCAEVCPVGLLPFNIASDLRRNDTSRLRELHVMDCIECGSCAYTCPAKVPLLDYCKLGKYEFKKRK
jgi:electron transport complex protein RnfC